MTVAYIVTTALLICVLAIRERDRDRTISRLIDQHNLERTQHTKTTDRERQLLLNRIKPETAQYLPDEGPVWAPPAVHPDVDAEYWESKEELAERLAREEIQA